jgi:hypothetical protein
VRMYPEPHYDSNSGWAVNVFHKKPKKKIIVELRMTNMRVEVDPEFKTLISPLTDDELKGLETKLLNEGFKEPLKGWAHDGIMTLLDGHNRLEICRRLGIKYRVEPVKGIEGRESAKKWIIDNQLSRRNLTREQARYLRGLMFNLEKRQGARTDLTSHQNDAKSSKGGVRKQLSEQYGVSEATLTRDGAYAGQIRRIKENAPDLAANILNQKV